MVTSKKSDAPTREIQLAGALREVIEEYQATLHSHIVALIGLRQGGSAGQNVFAQSTESMQSMGGGSNTVTEPLFNTNATAAGGNGRSVPLPGKLLHVDEQQMYPEFPPVEGWPFPNRGGVALPGGEVE